MTKVIAACLLLAAQTYSVPTAVLIGILEVEGGKIGQEVGPNQNGSYDLGPMQINTLWVPQLARHWGVTDRTAHAWVRDDACTNIGVAAWILRRHRDETGSLGKAIAYYHSRTPQYGYPYRRKVIKAMRQYGLIKSRNP